MDEDLFAPNGSSPIKNSTDQSSTLSPTTKALATNHTSLSGINTTKGRVFSKKFSTRVTSPKKPTVITSHNTTESTAPIVPYVLANTLVDQFNHYRKIAILSRIQQCDANMELLILRICATYRVKNGKVVLQCRSTW